MRNFFKNIGPGALIAAAFIGPGTVTVCTMAGVKYGYTLLWAMLLSIIATIVLQEMAARIGLVHGKGLAATVKDAIPNPTLKWLGIGLILVAILVGNAAYEAGNISGGVLGLQTLFTGGVIEMGALSLNLWSLLIGGIAFVLLYIGNYKIIERSLFVLVLLMSISFVITAILTKPDFGALLSGIFVPKVPEEGWLTVIGLVGTTVVPYNLFLHASLVKEKWNSVDDLKKAQQDTRVSIIGGGLVSMCIIICATAIQSTEINNAADLAKGLVPLYGEYAKYLMSLGLFAAGITSAITAPLAAAYVARGCFGWAADLKDNRFRGVWMFILILGILLSSIGLKPIYIIQLAQFANGLLLPIIAIFLLWVVNKSDVLGQYKNSVAQNVIGVAIIIVTLVLGAKSLLSLFGQL